MSGHGHAVGHHDGDHGDMTWWTLVKRILATIGVLMIAYNPYGFSYWHWMTGQMNMPIIGDYWGWKYFISLLVVLSLLLLLRNSYRAVGLVGLMVLTFIVITGVRVVNDLIGLNLEDRAMWEMTAIVAFGTVMGVALSSSYFSDFMSWAAPGFGSGGGDHH